MKYRFCLVLMMLAMLLSGIAMAQAPQQFSYQAVVRDASGRLAANQAVGVRISIINGGVTGNAVYVETHNVTTNSNGLFTLNIGAGSVQSGSFATISWNEGPYFIKSEIDLDGGGSYTMVSTQQLLSVPYALHASTAERLTTPFEETPQVLSISNDTIYLSDGGFAVLPAGFSGDYNDLTNKPTIPTNMSDLTNDAGYLTSETPQVLSISNDTIYLSNGGFVKLPSGVVVPTNVSEFTNDAGYITTETPQVLSISNDTIYLSDGGFAVLPAGFSGDYNDLTNKPTIPTNMSDLTNDAGYLTSETPQVLSISNDTIYLSDGGFAVLPAGFSGDYNDLTNKPTIPTNMSDLTNDADYIISSDIPTNVSAFINDAGYLVAESQSLTDVVANNNSAGHYQIKDVEDPTDSKDAVNLQFLMAQVERLQAQLDSISQLIPQPAGLPTVTTTAVSGITETSAVGGGSTTSSDGAMIFAKGVCWSTNTAPTISDSYTSDGMGEGTFTSSITGLTMGTTYYVRAYAVSAAGTAYGPQVSFKTKLYNDDITVNGYTFRMKYVEGGTFNMGAQKSNSGAANYDASAETGESPVHSVTLSSFYMGETEVTQGFWDAVMGSGSSSHGDWTAADGLGASYPAYNISYNDVQAFVTQLNTLTGRNFRMPTEAEWEYAARGGSQSHGYIYSGSSTIGNVAWYNSNGSVLHTVKGKTANELGLYDMSGNVMEWCSDWNGSYSSDPQTDPTGPASGTKRVFRGGGYANPAANCRVSYRSNATPTSRAGSRGFRLVMDTVGQVRPSSAVLPTVTTSGVSEISKRRASCGGNVTFSGGAEVTAKGVCWSLAPNPTISDDHTTSGTGEGSFTSTLIQLTGGTTYYVRAYATNSVGTAYGPQVSFTTPSPETNLDILVNGYTFRMKFVAGGIFSMGAQSTDPSGANYDADAYGDEKPVHSVALSGFYIGETEVTQGLWEAVMGSSSSSHDEWTATYGLGASYPAYNISYYDVQTFISQLNSLTGRNFRMPTEAEWEYAARGGKQSQGYKYSGSNTVGNVAWNNSNSGGKTHLVKGKSPNELGIYDMSGNVWELCRDWDGNYSVDLQINPTGLDSGSNRVRRGGAWNSSYVNENRVTRRDGVVPSARTNYIGVRLVLTE